VANVWSVTFTTSGPCSNSGATITLTGTGTCIVTAHQAGNSNYLAANDLAFGRRSRHAMISEHATPD